jgi:hypothetical protein
MNSLGIFQKNVPKKKNWPEPTCRSQHLLVPEQLQNIQSLQLFCATGIIRNVRLDIYMGVKTNRHDAKKCHL